MVRIIATMIDPSLSRVLATVRTDDHARSKGVRALARLLGITPAAISQWERVPLERVHDVARVTGIPVNEIRPDFFGPAT